MMIVAEPTLVDLANWRRLTAELYAAVRNSSESNPGEAWEKYRSSRDAMFRTHAQSPLDHRQRQSFRGLAYFPHNPLLRFRVPVRPLEESGKRDPVTAEIGEGLLRYRPFATAAIDSPEDPGRTVPLTLYWLEGYGGGLFLPFRDGTNGHDTYGGGRYLYDTIKGADLGAGDGTILLDFNFAYNPSCAYSPQWVCPLSPAANTLPFRIEAGERDFPGDFSP